MPWAEWMNVDPKSGVWFLLIIILAAFGINPIRSFAKRATRKNEADADEEASRGKSIRREDDAADRWYHIAQRAYIERDEAFAARDTARAEKHAALNRVQASLNRMQLECIEEVRKVEAKAEERIDEMVQKIAERDQTIAKLTANLASLMAKHEECITRNDELTATLNRRMDQAGFDPTRTTT